MADARRPLLLLSLVFLITGQEDACFNVAVQGTEKRIPCKATCSEFSITRVIWTLQSHTNSLFKWNITINQDGPIDWYNLPSGLSVSVEKNDVLVISRYSNLHSASVTCCILLSDNSTCNSSHLILTVLVPPPGISNFLLTPYPTILSLDSNYHHRYAGQSFGLCLHIRRDGVSTNKNKTYWSNGNIRIFPQYVTNGTCSDCQCLFDQIRANPRARTQAFLYLFKTEQCYLRYDKFRAVLFLHQAELVDRGSYRFYFTDLKHTYTGNLKPQSLYISYASIEPKFITPPFDKTIEMIKETNKVIFCNATTSIGQSLEWIWQGIGPINKSLVNCTSPLSDCVCDKEGCGIYEILVVKERKSLPQQNEGAYFMHYSIALVICNNSFVVNTNFTCQIVGNVTYKRHLFIIVPGITASPSATVVASPIPLSSSYLTVIFILIPMLVLLFVLVFVFVCCLIVYCLRFRAQKRHTSPDLPLSPLLDIDSMEFPRDRLTLDVLLGEGQFGEVWKAQAVGIVPGDHSRNVVAVKTVKSTGTHLDEDDLVSELNIMKIIKPHPNILNLLGYCTKPYDRPLYIIMEYAAHGNLRNYLKNLRSIQQHPPHSCHITYTDLNGSVTYVSRLHVNTPCPPTPCKTLGEYLTLREQNEEPCLCDVIDTPRCPYCCHGNVSEDSWRLYANLLEREGDNHQSVLWQHVGSSDYYNQYVIEGGGPIEPTSEDTRQQRISCVSTVSTPCHVTTKATPSDTSKKELPNLTDISHVTAKDPPNLRCMTTEEHSDLSDDMTLTEDPNLLLSETDVFNFALQIARGMEHLEKMRCLHRDLAARNILIAEGFLLKVADFGLSRQLKDKDYYRKLTSGKLPARWMALESLDSERLHTHKSDVWSFGVVLWEILTYGDVPYCTGDIASTLESLLLFIKDGNRLPRPDQCSDEMYKLMLQCWDVNPTKRPSFSELVKIFDGLLSIAHGYLPMAEDVASNQSLEPVELDSTPSQTECQVVTQTAPSNLTLSENAIQCSTPRDKEELNSLTLPVSFKWPSVNDTALEDEACKPKTLDLSTKKPLQRTSELL